MLSEIKVNCEEIFIGKQRGKKTPYDELKVGKHEQSYPTQRSLPN